MHDESSIPGRTLRGYLIMAALLAAAVVVFNADSIAERLRGHIELVAIVPRAEGVRVGSTVWVAGVASGRVTRIAFLAGPAAARAGLDSTAVALDLRLDRRARDVITRASDVQATRLRFIGQPVVRIGAGQPGDAPVDNGDTLRARPRPDPMDLLEQGLALPEAMDSLLGSVRAIQTLARRRGPEIGRLGDRMAAVTAAADTLSSSLARGSIGRMLDPEIGLPARAAALQRRLAELQEAGTRVLERYAGVAAPVAAPEGPGLDPDTTAGRRRPAPEAGDGAGSAGTTAGAATADGAMEGAALAVAVDGLMRRADGLRVELDTLQARLDRGRGFLVRAPRDSALQVAVRGVQAQIDSLTAEALSLGLRMLLP